jgi:hypothetical protein
MPRQPIFPYTSVALTGTINKLPNDFGLLQALDLFPSRSIASTVVEVRMREGKIEVLASAERGGPAPVASSDEGQAIYFGVPHFPEIDLLTPKDIQDMIEVEGDQIRARTAEEELAWRLMKIRRKHAITREYLRMGALKGVVLDGKGKVIADLFERFDIEKKRVAFDLDNDEADIIEACEEVFDHIATNLKGEVMTGVDVIVDKQFFNKLIQHPKIEKFYLNWQAAQALTSHDRSPVSAYGRTFSFQNVMFREYKAQFPVRVAGAPASVPAVAAGLGHAHPVGTLDTFVTYDASPHAMSQVNAPGVEIFVTTEELKHDEGIELKSQSNPLPICRMPALLVEVTDAATIA